MMDDQLQVKKDTLWEIHEQKCRVACLEKKVQDNFDDQKRIAKAWENGRLEIVGEMGVMVTQRDGSVTKRPTTDPGWLDVIHASKPGPS